MFRDRGIGRVRQADLLEPDRRDRAGISLLATTGKKPSSSTWFTSSIVSDVVIVPPISRLPRPSSVIGRSRCDGSPSSDSFASRA